MLSFHLQTAYANLISTYFASQSTCENQELVSETFHFSEDVLTVIDKVLILSSLFLIDAVNHEQRKYSVAIYIN